MLKYPKKRFQHLCTCDAFIIMIITMISFVLRMWIIQSPSDVVFDEVYFGNFTNYYLTGTYYFDVHPPFGKLVTALIAYAMEYRGDINFGENPGDSYKNPDYVELRTIPAFFGSLCVPLIYITVRFSGFSIISALVSASFVLLDTSSLTEHRFILSDGILHFFSCLFLVVYTFTVTLPRNSTIWSIMHVVSGILLGLCGSCKNTAWGFMIYAAYVEITQILQYKTKIDKEMMGEIFDRGFLLGMPTFFTILFSFCVHIIVLPYDGPGSLYLYMDMKMQLIRRQIETAQLWAKRLTKPNLYMRIISIFFDMFLGNMNIKSFHPSQSRPLNWPLLTGRTVDCWAGENNLEIKVMGNPVVHYSVFFSLILILLYWKDERFLMASRFIFGWAASYFPFFLIPRSMYLYHYILPLFVGCMNLGALIELAFKPFYRGFVGALLISAALFSFCLYCPFSYGTHHGDVNLLYLSDAWENGDAVYKSLAARKDAYDDD